MSAVLVRGQDPYAKGDLDRQEEIHRAIPKLHAPDSGYAEQPGIVQLSQASDLLEGEQYVERAHDQEGDRMGASLNRNLNQTLSGHREMTMHGWVRAGIRGASQSASLLAIMKSSVDRLGDSLEARLLDPSETKTSEPAAQAANTEVTRSDEDVLKDLGPEELRRRVVELQKDKRRLEQTVASLRNQLTVPSAQDPEMRENTQDLSSSGLGGIGAPQNERVSGARNDSKVIHAVNEMYRTTTHDNETQSLPLAFVNERTRALRSSSDSAKSTSSQGSGRSSPMGFRFDEASKDWKPTSSKSPASVSTMNVNSRRKSRDRSFDDVKASLVMIPIAKKGETVEQAIDRVSTLRPPKRPSIADLSNDQPSSMEGSTGLNRSAGGSLTPRTNEQCGPRLQVEQYDQKEENNSPTVRKTSIGHGRVAELLATSPTKPQLKVASVSVDPSHSDISPTDTTVVQHEPTPLISQQPPSVSSTTKDGDISHQQEESNNTATQDCRYIRNF